LAKLGIKSVMALVMRTLTLKLPKRSLKMQKIKPFSKQGADSETLHLAGVKLLPRLHGRMRSVTSVGYTVKRW
jgi:hypothetical protein